MSHTDEAAKGARQKMLSMIPMFGNPAMMFTVTVEDGFNFRIQVMANDGKGTKEPPTHINTPEVLKEFGDRCASTRADYPGYKRQ